MIDSTEQRALLSRYPTGVAVVCTRTASQNLAITVNSFASVSLDPPLVLWSIGKASDRYEVFRSAQVFTVNILAAGQEAIAQRYAFQGVIDPSDLEPGTHGGPRIAGSAGALECRQFALHPGGDHDILVGEITSLHEGKGVGSLTFYNSGYGRIG
ncbi:MAG: flavin reductase [Maricaulis sp.]|nr:flavin reductase [Maricaulis sp.]HAQ34398.1 flavin reductase [Alphaproteobacteria bacterium]